MTVRKILKEYIAGSGKISEIDLENIVRYGLWKYSKMATASTYSRTFRRMRCANPGDYAVKSVDKDTGLIEWVKC
jgi:hypothetical protein